MSKKTTTKKNAYKNLLVIGFVFFCIFTAFQAIQNLQTSLHDDPKLGFVSLAVLYAVYSISSLLVPPLLISKLGCKKTLIFSMVGYNVYTLANFFPSWETLVAAAAIIGFTAAPLWSTKGTYVSKIAMNYAESSSQAPDVIIRKFFAIFFTIFQMSGVIGNLISSLILKPTQGTSSNITKNSIFFQNNTNSNFFPNITDTIFECGSDFCTGSSTTPTYDVNKTTVRTLMIIYQTLGLFGMFIAILGLEDVQITKKEQPMVQIITSTFYMLFNIRIILLIPMTVFSGLQLGFVVADFNEAFVTCSVGIEMVGFVMIASSLSNAVFSTCISVLVKYISRTIMLAIAAVLNIGLIIWALLMELDDSSLLYLFVFASMFGVIDATLQSQTNAMYALLFPNQHDVAFSLMRLFHAIGFTISFAYGPYICVTSKLYILMGLVTISILMYYVLEYKERTMLKEKKYNFDDEIPTNENHPLNSL